MNAGNDRRIRRHSGFEVVLGFVIVAIREGYPDSDSARHMVTQLLGEAQIENGEPGSNNGRIIAIEPVVVDRAHAQRSAPAAPGRQRQAGIGNKVRRAVHINAMVAALEEGVSRSWSCRHSATGGASARPRPWLRIHRRGSGPLNSKLPSSGM